ncbi:ABC transporter permease [Streptomyces thermodiastaticus]|uniref:ABC transporter permease n=1 Tax=Streptomyces thermodiastaticus TaxID=44061 RepID=UPI001E31C175|nr:ABC transporter permease [Streptomyces thermodiastaticus]MCE7552905.1 ABC transporter permease [Streptomyces thermodiastaticus]
MTGFTGWVLLRARAHRLLLAAAWLTILLTTTVLATLTAYASATGDAALRHWLRDERNAAGTTLAVEADLPPTGRAQADAAVRRQARTAFDGLPVTVRTLTRSGPYALPRSLQPAAQRSGDPDLTYFAALDLSQVRLVSGRLPHDGAAPVEAALPQAAAQRLGLRPGDRLTLADRLGGGAVQVRITGVYRPADPAAPYWQLDDLGGRGVRTVDFTTYGPLLARPRVLAGEQVTAGQSAWQASADFSAMTTGRIGAVRDTVRDAADGLRRSAALGGSPTVTTALPDVLSRLERSLLVSRSTLLIAALQLALLAGCALLLVARLLSGERAGETRLLRARGASRGRIAALAATEALSLALPAVVCAALLAGPLTRLLARQGPLARIGLRPQVPAAGTGAVWLTAAAVALGCALAVTLPALTGGVRSGRRSPALAAPLRAGADLGLLAVAAVAYWQLSRQSSGALGTGAGGLGVDPLLVTAPALALLAGTVLTLRLLPPLARLAERRAAGGRGLPAALAGWQLSRRPARGAGPTLLLVLAVALGMLAIGQGASWQRSQDDQADVRAGAPVRLLTAGDSGPGRDAAYTSIPHVRSAAPAVRTSLPLSGDRTATVLALDTARAAGTVLMRRDLASEPAGTLLHRLAPRGTTAGVRVPEGTGRLRITAAVRSSDTAHRTPAVDLTVTLEDRYGMPYRMPLGSLPADGRASTFQLSLPAGAGATTLTGIGLSVPLPVGRAEQHRLTVPAIEAVAADGTTRRLAFPASWTAAFSGGDAAALPDGRNAPTAPRVTSSRPLTVVYGTGYIPREDRGTTDAVLVRVQAAQPAQKEVTAVATDRFLAATGARPGQHVEVAVAGHNVPVRLVAAVRALPTVTGAAEQGAAEDAAHDGGGVLLDLRAVNRLLQARYGDDAGPPTEWWLDTEAADAGGVAAALRALPDVEPAQVVVREEIAAELRDDPFGAVPAAAFTAAAVIAAALAAVGFAMSAAGALRERDAEFAVLRVMGTPRRLLARMLAAEQGVLLAMALVVGVALGTVLTRAVVPLIVLTGQATKPVPAVLVELPVAQVALLLAAVAVTPLVVTAVLSLRRADPAVSLRERGGE